MMGCKLGIGLRADFGRLVCECPLVADLGRLALERPLVANFVTLVCEQPLLAVGRFAQGYPQMADFNRLPWSTFRWPI